MAVQKPTFVTHHPVNPFVVDTVMPFQSQASPDTAVAVSGAVLEHIGNGLLDDSVITAWGDFLKSVHSDGRPLFANTWLRDTLGAQQTALTARPRAILASAQSTFLLWQSPLPP